MREFEDTVMTANELRRSLLVKTAQKPFDGLKFAFVSDCDCEIVKAASFSAVTSFGGRFTEIAADGGYGVLNSAKIYSRYFDGFLMKFKSSSSENDFISGRSGRVINVGGEKADPVFAVAFIMTCADYLGTLKGKTVAVLGKSAAALSVAAAAKKCRMKVICDFENEEGYEIKGIKDAVSASDILFCELNGEIEKEIVLTAADYPAIFFPDESKATDYKMNYISDCFANLPFAIAAAIKKTL